MAKIGRLLQTWDASLDSSKSWVDFVNVFEQRMLKRNASSYWEVVKVTDHGKSKDIHYVTAVNGDELLLKVLTAIENSFYVHTYGTGFAIQHFSNLHPDGDEWYLISSISKKKYTDKTTV